MLEIENWHQIYRWPLSNSAKYQKLPSNRHRQACLCYTVLRGYNIIYQSEDRMTMELCYLHYKAW